MKKSFSIQAFDADTLIASITPFYGNPAPLKNIVHSLKLPPYECKTVLKELDYVDKDYQDEYAAYYCKAFKPYNSRCTRLHFFSCEIPPETSIDYGKFSDHYLGYVVIRPTDLQRVGRTVLRPSLTDKDRQFFHCVVSCHANILGQEFKVSGMPFIQQDTQVGACAQASLWMLARYMRRKFGYREYLPSEINNLAKTNMALGRPLPAQNGLNSYQMLDALKGMGIPALIYTRNALKGCSPHIEVAFPVDPKSADSEQQQDLQNTVKLADIAYRYIESGLPVIIGTNSHALVGIGHTLQSSCEVTAKVAIQRIPAFYVNNDNTGPYRKMPIFCSAKYSFDKVQSVIPVLPHEVSLRGDEAVLLAREYVEELLGKPLAAGSQVKYREFISKINPALSGNLDQLESRTFLQHSVVLQMSLREDMNDGRLNKEVAEKLLLLDYPKYVWVTEVSSSSLLNHVKRQDRKCVGRLICDSTAPSKTRGVIAMHVADSLILFGRQSDTNERPKMTRHFRSTPFAHKLLSQS